MPPRAHPRRGQPRSPSGGTAGDRRRQLSQNFFRVADDARAFAGQLSVPAGAHVVEIGAGSGQITQALTAAGYPVLALEIDPYWADQLEQRRLTGVRVRTADAAAWRPEERPVVLIGNLPFGTGTQILRHALELGPETVWGAVFLLQSEYVGKRTGRWGGNLFNVQWWPWYQFRPGLAFRQDAFRPVPRTDAATLIVEHRDVPLLPWPERKRYQDFAARIFNTGHMTIGEAARTAMGRSGKDALRRAGIPPGKPVKALEAAEWAGLYRERVARPPAGSPRPRTRHAPRPAGDGRRASRTGGSSPS